MTERTTEQLAQALEHAAGYCKTDGAPDAPALCRESAAKLRDLERKLGETKQRWNEALHFVPEAEARATAAESALASARAAERERLVGEARKVAQAHTDVADYHEKHGAETDITEEMRTLAEGATRVVRTLEALKDAP